MSSAPTSQWVQNNHIPPPTPPAVPIVPRIDKDMSLLLQPGNCFSRQDCQFMLAFHFFVAFLCPFLQFMLCWFKTDLGCDERALGEKVT